VRDRYIPDTSTEYFFFCGSKITLGEYILLNLGDVKDAMLRFTNFWLVETNVHSRDTFPALDTFIRAMVEDWKDGDYKFTHQESQAHKLGILWGMCNVQAMEFFDSLSRGVK
jgi:hypothetical protein